MVCVFSSVMYLFDKNKFDKLENKIADANLILKLFSYKVIGIRMEQHFLV